MTSASTDSGTWQQVTLQKIFEIRAAGDIDWSKWRREKDQRYPYPVYANGRANSGLHGYASYAVEAGNAVTLTARGTIGELGYAFFRAKSFTPIGRLLVLRPKQGVNALFYTSYINSRVRFAQENTGVAQLTAPQISQVVLDLPPLPEQAKIAAVLNDVDALLNSLDRLIAKKRDLKQAAMQQLLTGQTRLPGFSGEWELKRLGDVVEIRKGQLITSSTLQQGDIPVIAGGKQPAYFHSSANRVGRTVTISASGASAGYVALYNEPIFASDCSTIGESDDYCLDFVFFHLLNAQQTIYKAQTGGAQPHIHAKDLNPILFAFPPKSEQTAIANVLTKMDAELVALEQRRNKTAALKQGMMHELLTGRTRLV